MEKVKNTTDKLGKMPIPKLVLVMSAPAILSMMVQAMYNIVDAIFVSGYSEAAFTAISLAFPIQLVIIAVSVGTGVGINSMVSRKLGAKDLKGAANSAEHGILLLAFFSIALLFLGLFTSKFFFGLFTKEAELIEYGTTYITIIMAFSVGRMMSQSFMSILQGSGNMIIPMVGQMIGAVTNIILDPILIYGTVFDIYFCEPMGVQGAAIATVIGQSVSFLFLAILFFTREHAIKLNLKNFKFSGDILSGILKVAFPAMIAQSIISVMVVGINSILATVSIAAVTAMGAYIKIQSFVLMPIFGLSTGVMPICGYNYGAKNKQRFIQTVKYGWLYASVVATIGFILFQTIPRQLLSIFTLSDQVVSVGIYTMRILGMGLPIAAAVVIMASAMQAIGKAAVSMISNFLRGILVLLPLMYLFIGWFGLNYAWWAGPIADITALVFIGINFRRVLKKMEW